jgi:hypothetical protein
LLWEKLAIGTSRYTTYFITRKQKSARSFSGLKVPEIPFGSFWFPSHPRCLSPFDGLNFQGTVIHATSDTANINVALSLISARPHHLAVSSAKSLI